MLIEGIRTVTCEICNGDIRHNGTDYICLECGLNQDLFKKEQLRKEILKSGFVEKHNYKPQNFLYKIFSKPEISSTYFDYGDTIKIVFKPSENSSNDFFYVENLKKYLRYSGKFPNERTAVKLEELKEIFMREIKLKRLINDTN